MAKEAGLSSSEGFKEIDDNFNEALSDDFNTALALSELFGYFKKIKTLIAQKDETAVKMLNQIKETYSLLGIFTKDAETFVKEYEKTHAEEVPEEILSLAQKMQEARTVKDYASADSLRAQIIEKGYTVMISKNGVEVKKA